MAQKSRTLTTKQIEKKLSGLSSWSVNKKQTELEKAFKMPSFVAGLAFTAKVAVHAEVLGHHPEIELSYERVIVKLSTHDVKGLTNADFELAKRIDQVTS